MIRSKNYRPNHALRRKSFCHSLSFGALGVAAHFVKLGVFIFMVGALLSPAMGADDVVLPPSRAVAQLRQADAILFFDGADRLYFERPAKHDDPFPLTALAARVEAATTQRAMIVVIMSKPTRMWPDEKFKIAVDDLEALLRKAGFKKVIFHLASGSFPTPIYRE